MTTIATERRLLTVREAAAAVRVNPATIYRAIETGRLQALRVGGGLGPLRIEQEALTDYLQPVRP
jgi:excisionase family DNA binding protein